MALVHGEAVLLFRVCRGQQCDAVFSSASTVIADTATAAELGRRAAVGDPGLTIVHANAGGIDVGN